MNGKLAFNDLAEPFPELVRVRDVAHGLFELIRFPARSIAVSAFCKFMPLFECHLKIFWASGPPSELPSTQNENPWESSTKIELGESNLPRGFFTAEKKGESL